MSASASSPTVLGWYIALELARLRKRSGLSLQQVADRLRCSKSHVQHLEAGRNLPPGAELELLLELFGMGERIPAFGELLDAARGGEDWWKPFAGTAPAWFDLFLGLESSAVQIESYDAQVVPGLFQTSAYAEAVIRAGTPDLDDGEVGRRIVLRQARQEVLVRQPEPPSVWSILDESVLHRTAGTPETMREQLRHLLKLGELPHVNVLVQPMSLGPHPGLDGTFIILSFADLVGSPAFGYTDGLLKGTYYSDAAEVLRYRNVLNRLHNSALPPVESQAMIRRRVEELM